MQPEMWLGLPAVRFVLGQLQHHWHYNIISLKLGCRLEVTFNHFVAIFAVQSNDL